MHRKLRLSLLVILTACSLLFGLLFLASRALDGTSVGVQSSRTWTAVAVQDHCMVIQTWFGRRSQREWKAEFHRYRTPYPDWWHPPRFSLEFSLSQRWNPADYATTLVFPLWPPVIILGLWPAIVACKAIRRRRRQVRGFEVTLGDSASR